VALLLVPLAVIVAGALLLFRLRFQPPTVPVYVLAGAGAGAGGTGEVDLRHGGTFTMELRPTSPVEGAVGARGFLVRGETVRPWDAPFAVDRDGTVRVSGAVDALFAGVPAGPWDVAVAVGRPENLPTAPRDVLRARDRSAADEGPAAWHLVVEHGRLEP
jgi:hypothetical protein